VIYANLFAIIVNLRIFVRYNHEILLIKHAKPNEATHFVRYNRVFVVVVIVLTEFDCILILKNSGYMSMMHRVKWPTQNWDSQMRF